MLADVGARGPQDLAVGCAAALVRRHLQLEDPLAHQRPRHIGFHLLQEPFDQPADFRALERILGQKAAIPLHDAIRLVEIFRDDRRPTERPHTVVNIDR
ncbi:hypothetical protein D3C71_1817270 [compost metagenome]